MLPTVEHSGLSFLTAFRERDERNLWPRWEEMLCVEAAFRNQSFSDGRRLLKFTFSLCYTYHRPRRGTQNGTSERACCCCSNINIQCNFNESRSLSRTQRAASRVEFQKIINLWKLVPLIGNETAPGAILRRGKSLFLSPVSLSLSFSPREAKLS